MQSVPGAAFWRRLTATDPPEAPTGSAVRHVAPFAVALLLGFPVVAFGRGHDHLLLLGIAFALFVALAVAVAAVPWHRAGPVARVLPVFAVFPIIVLMRHAEGGSTSAYAPLIALPLLWLALYGNRRELTAGLVVGAATLALPPLVVGPPMYPRGEWARLAMYVFIAPIACFVVQDLMSRVRAQARSVDRLRSRLVLTEHSFRAAFADAPAAQFMCAPTGTVLRANDAMYELTGAAHDELLGAESADLFAAADAERVAEVLLELWSGERPGPVELQVRLAVAAEDEDVVVQLRLALVRTHDERPLYLLAHALDVTQRVAEARDSQIRAERGQAVRAATQRIGDSANARQLVCDAALETTGAHAATLMEADRDGLLVTTARSGPEIAPGVVRVGHGHSFAAVALASQDATLVRASDALPRGDAGGAVLFEPVLQDGVAIGVLVLAWPQCPADVPDEALMAAHLLAGETAAVLARSELVENLTRLAHHDPMTGLPNRRAWEELLPRELARAARAGSPLCVALIDIDHFKEFNDRYGHQEGDRLLAEAANAWRAGLRASDLLARYGGEEFAVVLPDCDAVQALRLLERLREATPGDTTCSVGVAAWDGREAADFLLDRADRALYEAKRTGRNCTRVSAVAWTGAPMLAAATDGGLGGAA